METIAHIAQKKERLIVGTMSGTSTDGTDVALLKISGCRLTTKFDVVAFDAYAYPEELLQRIFAVYPPNLVTGEQIARLSFDIAENQADAILHLISKANFRPEDIDLISLYGLTLFHGSPNREKGIPGTHLIIGEPAVVMERTGITVLADLRNQDVAVGGEGCPLVPYADWVIFRDRKLGRAVQNIGGIGNVTGVRPMAEIDDLIAFDTGPGNMVIDGLIKIFTNGRERFDRNGAMAAQGKVNEDLLNELMDAPFIQRKPPKSSGREDFGDQYCQWLLQRARAREISDTDLVATATALTAQSMAENYRRYVAPLFKIDEVILAGGGVHNATLVRMIRERLAPIKVLTHEDFGINSDAKEAIAWAIMGNDTIQGKTVNVPSATGSQRRALLGKLVLGHRFIVPD